MGDRLTYITIHRARPLAWLQILKDILVVQITCVFSGIQCRFDLVTLIREATITDNLNWNGFGFANVYMQIWEEISATTVTQTCQLPRLPLKPPYKPLQWSVFSHPSCSGSKVSDQCAVCKGQIGPGRQLYRGSHPLLTMGGDAIQIKRPLHQKKITT